MSVLTIENVKSVAHLARLNLSEQDAVHYTDQLSHIFDFVAQMEKADTTHIAPQAHAFDLSQRLRDDVITETNQRDLFQEIAPQVEAGLYLVPQVIDAE